MGGLQVDDYPQPVRSLSPGRGHPSRPVSHSFFFGSSNWVVSISAWPNGWRIIGKIHFQLEVVTASIHK